VTWPGIGVLGGGFCAVSPTRTTSPVAFLFLALASLALLRRRQQ
jgi:MYXO-CTERM domain-containing protein